VTVLCALISPQEESREWVRRHCERFVEIHVSTPLAECERRDVKGLYAAARRGELQGFTGVSAPYCAPKSPDLILNTVDVTLPAAVDRVLSVWAQRAFTETGAEVWMADRSRRGLAS
jgi:adenylylsulfate kinase-like enzyme